MTWLLLIPAVLILLVVVVLSACVAAGRADAHIEAMREQHERAKR